MLEASAGPPDFAHVLVRSDYIGIDHGIAYAAIREELG